MLERELLKRVAKGKAGRRTLFCNEFPFAGSK